MNTFWIAGTPRMRMFNQLSVYTQMSLRTLNIIPSLYNSENKLNQTLSARSVEYLLVGNPNRKKMHIFGFVGIF